VPTIDPHAVQEVVGSFRFAHPTALRHRDDVIVDLVDLLTPHRPMVVNSSFWMMSIAWRRRAGRRTQAVGVGRGDHAGFCAERRARASVLAGADAAVEHDLHPLTDGVDDLGQHLDRGRRAVELPAAMVGTTIAARRFRGELGVLDVEMPFRISLPGQMLRIQSILPVSECRTAS